MTLGELADWLKARRLRCHGRRPFPITATPDGPKTPWAVVIFSIDSPAVGVVAFAPTITTAVGRAVRAWDRVFKGMTSEEADIAGIEIYDDYHDEPISAHAGARR